MKKIYLLFLFLICSQLSYSQEEKPILLKVGLNKNLSYSNLFQNYTPRNVQSDEIDQLITTASLSYSFGVNFGINFHRNFQINTGINYKKNYFNSSYGNEEDLYSPISTISPLYFDEKRNFKSINLSISIAVKAFEKNKFQLFIETGFLQNFMLQNNNKESIRFESSILGGESISDGGSQSTLSGLKKRVISGFTQINFLWELNNRVELGIAPTFHYSFLPFNQYESNGKNLLPYQIGLTMSISKYF